MNALQIRRFVSLTSLPQSNPARGTAWCPFEVTRDGNPLWSELVRPFKTIRNDLDVSRTAGSSGLTTEGQGLVSITCCIYITHIVNLLWTVLLQDVWRMLVHALSPSQRYHGTQHGLPQPQPGHLATVQDPC